MVDGLQYTWLHPFPKTTATTVQILVGFGIHDISLDRANLVEGTVETSAYTSIRRETFEHRYDEGIFLVQDVRQAIQAQPSIRVYGTAMSFTPRP